MGTANDRYITSARVEAVEARWLRAPLLDIGAWRSLGLRQYKLVFRENAVDVETLPELTEADLEKLRFGLELVCRVRQLDRALSGLDARIGIVTGLVVVCELVGAGDCRS